MAEKLRNKHLHKLLILGIIITSFAFQNEKGNVWYVNPTIKSSCSGTQQFIDSVKNHDRTVGSQYFKIKGDSVLILTSDFCSGIYCPNFLFFLKEENELIWDYKLSGQFNFTSRYTLEFNDSVNVFNIISSDSIIGSLKFSDLLKK